MIIPRPRESRSRLAPACALTWGVACLLCVGARDRAAALEVTLDSGGAGTVVLSDMDNDGVVEFDTTVGGVFFARGIAKEDLDQPGKFLAIAPLSPFPEAVFRNVDSVERTFAVTVQSTAFAAAVGPPLGWDIFYNGTADDTMSGDDPVGVVGIPTHTVQAEVNAGAIPLGLVAGTAISAMSTIDEEQHGVDQLTSAADSRLVWTFTLGPEDEIRVPADNGFDGDSIQVNVFNQSQKCVDKMNNDSRKLADKAQKSDAKCVKKQTGDVTACVDDAAETKTDKKEKRLLDDFAAFCDPVPAWGVNPLPCCEGGSTDGALCSDILPCTGGDCVQGACISAAAENGANDLTHDLFGATVNVSTVKATRKCQKIVSKTAGKLLVDRWKVFRKCKRDNFTSISDDADLVSTCCGPPQPDPKDKIGKRETILAEKVSKVCLGKGVTSLGTVFPGSCAAVADSEFASCVAEAVACRFCQSINRTDAIAPTLDCDSFDDGVANSSCPP